jgi:hypothetical protein
VWLQRARPPETIRGADLDELSEPQLERLHAGLLKLASMDGTLLAALVERVLARDEPASSESQVSRVGPRGGSVPAASGSAQTLAVAVRAGPRAGGAVGTASAGAAEAPAG